MREKFQVMRNLVVRNTGRVEKKALRYIRKFWNDGLIQGNHRRQLPNDAAAKVHDDRYSSSQGLNVEHTCTSSYLCIALYGHIPYNGTIWCFIRKYSTKIPARSSKEGILIKNISRYGF